MRFISIQFIAITITMILSITSHAFKSNRFVSSTKNTATIMKFNRLLSLKGGAAPSDEESKPLYALGVNIARQIAGELKGLLSKDEIVSVVAGFSDSLLDKSGDERELLTKYGPAINELLTGRSSKLLTVEIKKGEDYKVKYLLSNPKAVQTSSGLIYNEIIAGTGAQPNVNNVVEVHYHGTLTDGTVFDSSVDRGEPIKFPLKNVIKGWQEGVALMKVGGKATLVVPYDLAYGENGSPPTIPGGATLIFEVQLLNVA